MLEQLFDWFLRALTALGYPAIFLIMLIESLVLAVPSEVVLPFLGFLAYEGKFSLVGTVIAATIGSLVGAIITYEVSRSGGRRFVRRYGTYFFLDEKHLIWSERLYLRYGEAAIFFSRLLPVVRQLISVPAGTTRTRRDKFILYTFAGSLLWNFILIYAGFLLGKEWQLVRAYTQPIDILVLIIIGAIITWVVFKRIEERTFLRHVRPTLVKRSKAIVRKGKEIRARGKALTRRLKKRI